MLIYIREKFPTVSKAQYLVYFSDGAASQYNNFKKLVNLFHHRRDHDLDAEWHFLLLAMENRPVTKTSLQATVTSQILTPQHMFALAIAGIKHLYINEKDIAKNFQDFAHEERYARCKTIPGTRSHHSFIPISETVLEMKRFLRMLLATNFLLDLKNMHLAVFRLYQFKMMHNSNLVTI